MMWEPAIADNTIRRYVQPSAGCYCHFSSPPTAASFLSLYSHCVRSAAVQVLEGQRQVHMKRLAQQQRMRRGRRAAVLPTGSSDSITAVRAQAEADLSLAEQAKSSMSEIRDSLSRLRGGVTTTASSSTMPSAASSSVAPAMEAATAAAAAAAVDAAEEQALPGTASPGITRRAAPLAETAPSPTAAATRRRGGRGTAAPPDGGGGDSGGHAPRGKIRGGRGLGLDARATPPGAAAAAGRGGEPAAGPYGVLDEVVAATPTGRGAMGAPPGRRLARPGRGKAAAAAPAPAATGGGRQQRAVYHGRRASPSPSPSPSPTRSAGRRRRHTDRAGAGLGGATIGGGAPSDGTGLVSAMRT
jgi:hypothetical protein